MRETLGHIRRWSNMPIGLQLDHAGRKASTEVPWAGRLQFAPGQPNGWQTEAPSAIPFDRHDHPPVALDRDGLKRVRDAFAAAAQRAARLGLDLIQLHCAHGYLLHQCRRSRISAPTNTAARSKTACAFRSKYST